MSKDTNPETAPPPKLKPVTIELISGVEGACLAVDGTRVAGPKPWGGDEITKTFQVDRSRLMAAMGVQNG